MTKVIDFSGARPSATQLRTAGYVGCITYIGAADDWRVPPLDLLASYRAAGLALAVVYEHGRGDFCLGGYQAGLSVGIHARTYANERSWRGPIYVATDIDIVPGQLDRAVDAYRGVIDGARPFVVGAYGGKLLLRAVHDRLGIDLLWSSNASAWDHGATVDGLALQQHFDQHPLIPDTDEDSVLTNYWGQWPYEHQEDDMPRYTEWDDADRRALAADVRGEIVGEPGDPNTDYGSVTLKMLRNGQAHQEQVLAAILTKIGVKWHWDQGAIVIDEAA